MAVCLAGLSPAVVTETLYGLVTRRPRGVIPRDVHIVTTHGAYPTLAATLLGPQGALARLRADYRLPAGTLRCLPDHVHVLADERGRPLDDIRTPADSRAAGEAIGRLVRELARDDGLELHCSLAGGRKTMSALLATALQLHGRAQDRLYHVLVGEPFERIPHFYYPSPRPDRRRLDGRVVDFHRARVELVEIPLVALGQVARRLGLDGLALQELARELEAEATGRLRPEPLEIDLAGRRVRVGDRPLRLSPQELGLYAFYAEGRRRCRRPGCAAGGACPACHPTDDEVHDRRARLIELYVAAGGRGGVAPLHGAGGGGEALAAFREWLQQTRSRLNRIVRRVLGPGPRAALYAIAPGEHGPRQRRRGLALLPTLVRLTPGPAARAPQG